MTRLKHTVFARRSSGALRVAGRWLRKPLGLLLELTLDIFFD